MPPAKREETPDVLGKLLGGKPPASPPEEPAEETLPEQLPEGEGQEEQARAEAPPEEKPTSKPAKQQDSKPARQRAKKPPELPVSDEKVKATYYLSPETLDFLESAWLKLRRLAGQEKRSQVSKSLIVELALQVALDDLRVRNEKSDIAGAIRRATQDN